MPPLHFAHLALRQSLKDCGLLSLPREIRDIVYYNLLSGKYSNLLGWSDDDKAPENKVASQLSILRVSRQFSEEGLPVFYRESSFQLLMQGLTEVKYLRRMLNRQSSTQLARPNADQIQRMTLIINLDMKYFKGKRLRVSELPVDQIRRLGNSGARSERCDVVISYRWWGGCECARHKVIMEDAPKETIKLLKKLSMFRTVTVEVTPRKPNFGSPSNSIVYPYPTLEKRLRSALGPGQLDTIGGFRKLTFSPSGQFSVKTAPSADFAVRSMGGHNIWSSLSDPTEDSEYWQ